MLYAVLATTALGLLVFYVMARYRYPLVPGLALLAGAALAAGLERARAGRWRELLPAGAVSLVLLPICNHTIFTRDFQLAQSLHNHGRRADPAGAACRGGARVPRGPASPPRGGGDLGGARGERCAASTGSTRPSPPSSRRSSSGRRAGDHSWQIGIVWLEKREFERARLALESATRMDGAGGKFFRSLASASQNSGHYREATPGLAPGARARPRRSSRRPCSSPSCWRPARTPRCATAPRRSPSRRQVAQARPDDVAALDVLAAAQAEQGRWERGARQRSAARSRSPSGAGDRRADARCASAS